MKIIGWLAALLFVAYLIGGTHSSKSSDPSAHDSTHTTATSKAAAPQMIMPGDGIHNIGGMDGKNWGIWEATAPGQCEWSIREVRTYAAGEITDEGTADPGQTVRVNIQPDGNVSVFTGMIDDDHRIVFMTHGCGAWRFIN